VIVGGVAGGASAAARARRLNGDAEIIVIEKDEHVSFANCGLPYYIGGEITDRANLLLATPQKFRAWFDVDVRTRHEAMRIDRDRGVLEVRDHAQGRDYQQPYDRLILAPGAAPIVPRIDGMDAPNVFTLRNLADTDGIKAHIDQVVPAHVTVVGAGYIGLEMVEMLRRRDLRVTLVEKLPQLMPPLDAEMAMIVQAELHRHEVDVRLGNGLKGLACSAMSDEGPGPVAQVILEDDTTVDTDMVIMGIGVRPNSALAQSAGLAVGDHGGIVVDRHMRTSDPNVYAVGDAVAYEHAVAGRAMRIPLAGPANRAGRIAGEHAATGQGPAVGAVLGTAIVRVFEVTAASTGLNARQAREMGLECTEIWVPSPHHAEYFPGAAELMVKLVFRPDDGKVLGAQVVGAEGVDKRIDVVATTLMFGATVDDLTNLDLAYAPPYGSAKDPIHIAAFVAQNCMADRDVQIAPTRAGEADRVQWLDVRMAFEWEAGHLDGAIWIPLHELRDRLDELDRNRPIVTICKGGKRSYFALRLLRQHGFEDVAVLSGGMSMQGHLAAAEAAGAPVA
jgi:NADPH-dependent 2,4-dienoyl-CoA reductase/sulfur reductase-like enzyme/rhodanese-related sulfurtransferase